MVRQHASRGQVLVLFVLFLLVLLGISALAIDYASWLLTDRSLQNYSDHAALAGASAFDDRTNQGTCTGGGGATQCLNARAQAWASLNNDLGLALTPTEISCLATVGPNQGNSPAAGETDSSRALTGACASGTAKQFGHKIWVSTPPPNDGSYTHFGGRYAYNFGVVWVRVDRQVRSFLGGALGIKPSDRTGWSTAGSLPTDFALQTFCRNNIAPQSGVCENSAGLTIDGQGGIRLLRGDLASNESLKVTAQGGQGVVLQAGNQFLVNGVCQSSTWNCPNGPPSLGGISDGTNGKNAFYMAPLPVPHYASPLDDVTVYNQDCSGADATHLCVPNRPYIGNGAGTPGDWSCTLSGSNPCGTPTVTTVSGVSTVRCDATVAGVPSRYLVPSSDGSVTGFNGTPINTNKRLYENVDDDATVVIPPVNDTTNPPAATPADYVYTQGNLRAGDFATAVFNLRPPYGIPGNGATVISYTVVKMNGSSIDVPAGSGNTVTATVSVLQNGVLVAGSTDVARTLTGTPAYYSYNVSGITDFTNLAIRIRFDNTSAGGSASDRRGGAVAFAQAYAQALSPALPAMIPPGYYHSISIGDGGCAIMDPTAQYWGYGYPALYQYQKPGIYRFGTGNDSSITLGSNAYLIGDGVTLVFNPEFPDPTGGRGIVIGSSGALVLNTSRVVGSPPCTPTESETATYNPSGPLMALPYSSVCAAWGVDPTTTIGVHPGANAWPTCTDTSQSQCVDRSQYNPTTDYQGITFYFTTNSWPANTIRQRFQEGGGSGLQPGIAFRGVLYAPYDDVKISGGNGFNTVGQVLSWTAKFNGGSAYIDLDYPYQFVPAKPYLLEPTVNQ